MGPGSHTYQKSRFGDGGHDRCSLGPKQSLERVVFSLKLKSPFLRGVERYVLGLQCHQRGWNFWLEWFIRVNRTWVTYRWSRLGDGGRARCSMGPKQSLERVFFSLKSPFLRGVQRHVLNLQCHQRGCDFWLGWSGWINGTWGACRTSSFGDGGHVKSSVDPKR